MTDFKGDTMNEVFESLAKIIGSAVLVLIVLLGVAALGAYPTKWIMNYLFAPTLLQSVFGVTKFTLLRAFCLNSIASTLIKGTTSVKA